MRVLFAAADRDLLRCYEYLLGAEGFEAATAFDGTQALTRLAEGGFSAAVVAQELPRVPWQSVLAECAARGVPTVLLRSEKAAPAQTCAACVELPFAPAELVGAVRAVCGDKSKGKEAAEDE